MAKIYNSDTTAVYLTAVFKNQMKRVTQYSCTLVEAPMGYGKTTGVRGMLFLHICHPQCHPQGDIKHKKATVQ